MGYIRSFNRLDMPFSVKAHKLVGVLLVNVGTPLHFDVVSVRRYLRQFLMDSRVIDIPWLFRFLFVNCLIVPFRGPVSAREYRKLWTNKGSPLQYHTAFLCKKLQDTLGTDYVVQYAMRYQQPSLAKVLVELQAMPLSQLILIPLFPQYASATTGSVIEFVGAQLRRWQVLPTLSVHSQFHLKEAFLQAWAARAAHYLAQYDWDAFLFSYHGLPVRQIYKSSRQGYCQLNDCCERTNIMNQYCYRAQCMQTTAALVKTMGLPKARCYTAFQSRLGKSPWIRPYVEDTINSLAAGGTKSVLVFAPSFTADCLETVVEIEETYKALFLSKGGKKFELIPSLNDSPAWVEALKAWVFQLSKLY